MTKDKALDLALKALRFARDDGYENEVSEAAITAIKQARSAPVQEPVAWATMLGNYSHVSWGKDRPDYPIRYEVPLYTTPPAQEFVCSTGLCHYKEQPALKPLTNEQVGKAARDAHIAFCLNKHQTYEHALTRAVEAAHGITGETK